MTQAAIDHVYSILGAVPHSEYGVVNLLPFAVESAEGDALKRDVATGIVNSLASAGHIASGEPQGTPTRSIRVLCRSCGTMLFSGTTDDHGGVGVAAPALLSMLARLRAECPHEAFTADDQRRYIEEMAQ